MESAIKKAVLMLDGKYYHAYDESMLDEAKKRARRFKDDGRKVTLKWEGIEVVNELESFLIKILNEIKELKTELGIEKKMMTDDYWTWGKCNKSTIKKVNDLEIQIKQLESSI